MSAAPDRDTLLSLAAALRADRKPKLPAAARRGLADWLEAKAPPAPAPRPSKTSAVAGRVLLHSDGACRGNPGPSAAGYVIYDGDGQEIYSEGVVLGTLTNNQSEYRALLLGLEAVARLGFRDVEIAMDSELIVRQLEGRYKVKNAGLKPLYEEARLKLNGFAKWQVRHVPRAENSVADGLANEALDSL